MEQAAPTNFATTGGGPETATRTTRLLLAGGIVAGPLYLASGFTQAFTRPGFDITRHPFSILANGPLGFVQILTFILCGLLVVGAAVGLGRTLREGRGRTWGPRLLGLYGVGLICAGIFRADPSLGFPVGTPEDYMGISWHGYAHMACLQVVLVGITGACFVLAARFGAQRRRWWQAYSLATGAAFLLSIVGFSMTMNSGWGLLALYAGVIAAWVWVSALSARTRSELPAA